MIAQKRIEPEPLALEEVVTTYLIGAVQYGYITIRYEAGRPTMVERHEQVRLTKERSPS